MTTGTPPATEVLSPSVGYAKTIGPGRAVVWPLLVVVFFAANAPLLTWMEFSNTMENLVVATAMEVRRTGHWLLPTLEGESRTKKPPLVAWITAAAIRPQTLREISNQDPTAREAAYRRLAWEARWPSLLAACLMLVAVYEFGRAIGDDQKAPTFGLVAALVCGGSFFFLRFGRTATSDVHLALWVNATNAFLAHAVFQRRRWIGCIGAGVAGGLAFMSKGPVSLLQTIVPLAAFLLWRRRRGGDEVASAVNGGWLYPSLAGVLAWAAVALPWYAAVLMHAGGGQQWSVWLKEVMRADTVRSDSPITYLLLVPYFVPWIPFLAIGGWLAISVALGREVDEEDRWSAGRLVLPLLLVLLPLAVMVCFKDRKDRYLFPLIGPTAVLCALGLFHFIRHPSVYLDRLQWVFLAVMVLVVPVAGAIGLVKGLRDSAGRPWYGALTGLAAAIALLLLLVVAYMVYRRRRSAIALAVGTTAVMLAWHAVFMAGYTRAPYARSEMMDLAHKIWSAHPDAVIYNAHPDPNKRLSPDLSIYLNRPTPWISAQQVSNLLPAERTQLIVMVVRPRTKPPAPPPGATLFLDYPHDEDHWRIYALPARP